MTVRHVAQARRLAKAVARRAKPDVRELIRPWLAALTDVPRELFVPDVAWADPRDGPGRRIDRLTDLDGWLHAVYNDGSIITQRDDGATDPGDPAGRPSCSLSAPSISLQFLARLGLRGHEKVLEIGTGTGWTTAALCWWLGEDARVISVEVDGALARQAAKSLAAIGCHPTVLTADGAIGYPGAAPYDRVHVTCGVRTVSYAWIEQTRPGGIVVLPWMPSPGRWGEQLVLRVLDDGSAVGRFTGDCGYMMLRAQRVGDWPAYGEPMEESVTRLDPRTVDDALAEGLMPALAVHTPHLVVTTTGWDRYDGEDAWVMRLREAGGSGWALCAAIPGNGDYPVLQGGGVRLWDQLQATYMDWARRGCPSRSRYGMTVTPDGKQHVWLNIDEGRLP
ncbi:protein-L-isoaspartate(D-aspartate) O-methyltransferase [Rhizohabitans arisaemae]|uniref:protein-L-isoaspartate(D-aspartate) O-methyltransferase n=1 Tax=Rhizohabitans arisaemae TaxID=2720610 RepID=UPI0024B19D39|nr:protein-L-isoaspartate(D-aspartate) O-methyltransferase [Rhizohabitans arisaemae]